MAKKSLRSHAYMHTDTRAQPNWEWPSLVFAAGKTDIEGVRITEEREMCGLQ